MLAATLSANYGIYGPAFELGESTPREPGSEEYLDSEKYQQRTWDLERPRRLRELIARVNRMRARATRRCRPTSGCGSTRSATATCSPTPRTAKIGADVILTVVNLDSTPRQSGVLELDLAGLGLPVDRPFQVRRPARRRALSAGRARAIPSSSTRAPDPAHVLWLEAVTATEPSRGRLGQGGQRRHRPGAALVQGRGHLRGARPRVLRQRRRRHRRLPGPRPRSSTTSPTSASPRSGCCRSIRRRCKDDGYDIADYTSVNPSTARCATSRRSSARRTRAACA